MGFFSNIFKLVFIACAIVICIGYIVALATPWYLVTVNYPIQVPYTGDCKSERAFYWFETKTTCSPAQCNEVGCSWGEPFPGIRVPELCTPYGCASSNAVFIAQFVFNLLAFLAFLAATIIYALPMVGNKMSAWVLTVLAIVFLLVAILVTFALPSAAQADVKNNPPPFPCPPEGGPCSSWAGSATYNSTGRPVTETWGPAGGWIWAIIVGLLTVAWLIIVCCCCSHLTEEESENA